MSRWYDGYSDGRHFQDLMDLLGNYTIEDHPHYGMEALAAKIVTHFRNSFGDIHIQLLPTDTHNQISNEYDGVFNVFPNNKGNKVNITDSFGWYFLNNDMVDDGVEEKDDDEETSTRAEFKYDKGRTFTYENGWTNECRWRSILLSEETDDYLIGLDEDDGLKVKRFNKDKIVDGKIFKTKVPRRKDV